MNDHPFDRIGVNDNTDDNMILPFELQASHLRGRVVRLGSTLDEILKPHAYPQPVARLVAEAATLTLLLAGMLKFDGIFTLQAQGSGPIRMIVADLTTHGDLRAVATFDEEAVLRLSDGVTSLNGHVGVHDLSTLMGDGHLAFTVDQGDHTDRYQGIVALAGESLSQAVQHYFTQSEQIQTLLKVAVSLDDDRVRAGGLMVQRLPVADNQAPETQDDWTRAEALLVTCTPQELTHPILPATDLLFRLFHEEGVRVFNPVAVKKGCRCDMDRLMGILRTLSPDDLSHMTVDGRIVMTCEFCRKDFLFDPQQLTE